jgi:hypothetical protein
MQKIAMTSLRENEKGLRNENYGKCSFSEAKREKKYFRYSKCFARTVQKISNGNEFIKIE